MSQFHPYSYSPEIIDVWYNEVDLFFERYDELNFAQWNEKNKKLIRENPPALSKFVPYVIFDDINTIATIQGSAFKIRHNGIFGSLMVSLISGSLETFLFSCALISERNNEIFPRTRQLLRSLKYPKVLPTEQKYKEIQKKLRSTLPNFLEEFQSNIQASDGPNALFSDIYNRYVIILNEGYYNKETFFAFMYSNFYMPLANRKFDIVLQNIQRFEERFTFVKSVFFDQVNPLFPHPKISFKLHNFQDLLDVFCHFPDPSGTQVLPHPLIQQDDVIPPSLIRHVSKRTRRVIQLNPDASPNRRPIVKKHKPPRESFDRNQRKVLNLQMFLSNELPQTDVPPVHDEQLPIRESVPPLQTVLSPIPFSQQPPKTPENTSFSFEIPHSPSVFDSPMSPL